MEIITYLTLFLSNEKPKFIISKHVDNVFFQGSIGQKKHFIGAFYRENYK